MILLCFKQLSKVRNIHKILSYEILCDSLLVRNHLKEQILLKDSRERLY